MSIVLQFVQPLHDGTILCPVEDIKTAIAGVRAISVRVLQILAERAKNGTNP